MMKAISWLVSVLAFVFVGTSVTLALLAVYGRSDGFHQSVKRGKLERICASDTASYDPSRVGYCGKLSKRKAVTERYDFVNMIWIQDHNGKIRNEVMTAR